MEAKYSELTEISQLEKLNSLKKFLIFKHSPQCSISLAAFEQFKSFLSSFKTDSTQFFYVDVIKGRPVSQEIAKIYNIQHESPQVLLISDSKVISHTSHRNITKENLLNICTE